MAVQLSIHQANVEHVYTLANGLCSVVVCCMDVLLGTHGKDTFVDNAKIVICKSKKWEVVKVATITFLFGAV